MQSEIVPEPEELLSWLSALPFNEKVELKEDGKGGWRLSAASCQRQTHAPSCSPSRALCAHLCLYCAGAWIEAKIEDAETIRQEDQACAASPASPASTPRTDNERRLVCRLPPVGCLTKASDQDAGIISAGEKSGLAVVLTIVLAQQHAQSLTCVTPANPLRL